jgi:hypothetical protein
MGRNNGSQHPASGNGFIATSDHDASHLVPPAQSTPAQTAAAGEEDAADAEKAVRAQTIKFGFWRRGWLRYVAWWAKNTGGEFRLFWWFRPKKFGRKSFKEYFTNNASLFGDLIYEEIRPSALTQRLEALISSHEEPFLIVRGVFSRRFLQASLTRTQNDDGEEPERLLEKRRYDLVASALIAATKTALRRKLEQDTPHRDYLTEVSAEINQFVDGKDMHLRHRTATPELPPANEGLNTAARIIVFACIENPIAKYSRRLVCADMPWNGEVFL